MDLTTRFMGLDLTCPLIVGASPICDSVDAARIAEDAGAGAVVLRSLFEEQLRLDQAAMHHHIDLHANAHAEALSYFPEPDAFGLGPEEYVEQIARLKAALDIPVIGSLNGVTDGGWVHYAKTLEQAGADGLELNVYYLAFDPDEPPRAVEQRYIDILASVKADVSIPVTVKLSPFFSAPLHTATRLAEAGADGLVLFNRFYQPDIDIDELEIRHTLELSTPHTLLLRLRWLAGMYGQVGTSLCASGGIHDGRSAIKSLMAGADVVQLISTLLKFGPAHLGEIRAQMVAWMEENEYESVRQMIGSMSLLRCPNPRDLERANYMHVLQSWHVHP